MIIRSFLRPRSAAQCLQAVPKRCFAPSAVRSIHQVPTLQNHTELKQNGIPGLLSPEGFKMAYLDYHSLILKELNQVTADIAELQNQEVKSLVIELARDPVKAYAFNLASMAYNNHFFFKGIATDPNVVSQPSTDLSRAISENFSSFSSFREEFLATAEAMFGPGFVWLVQTNDARRSLRILPTYLAGSPLSGAHYRRQTVDLNTENINSVGAFGAAAKAAKQGGGNTKKALGGVDVVPLMCVNTWEHVWLTDYGIGGKMEYLEKWFNKIDWNVVQESTTLTPTGRTFDYGSMGRQGSRNKFAA